MLIAFQAICAVFFLFNILSSWLNLPVVLSNWQVIEIIEICAALGLLVGVGVTARLLVLSIRARRVAEDNLRLASGAFMTVLNERFDDWGLTPAERDVALFTVKGATLSDIAVMRNTSEGTVKAQSTAIYRKAGVNSRAQLLSLFIDDLMGDALPGVVDAVEPLDKAG
ncbi:helix-turn-helix transcriptional regulator [Roseovarius faecimaris]|uniref:Helix-turn-helix transcriptional regulator n=1 Tax=Roseovarius faecimaris TaxID=2494550 RepID=A0A6I6IQF1_9RHOB|nr:helix-turn-helix transcriptional regulator [Roseovarius faecimaris]